MVANTTKKENTMIVAEKMGLREIDLVNRHSRGELVAAARLWRQLTNGTKKQLAMRIVMAMFAARLDVSTSIWAPAVKLGWDRVDSSAVAS